MYSVEISSSACVRINYEKKKGKFPCDHHVLCKYKPRDDTLGNSLERSSSARANVSISCEKKTKIKFSRESTWKIKRTS